MRRPPIDGVEKYRIRDGQLASSRFDGNCGAFRIPFHGVTFGIIASDGLGWDHVSVSLPDRCPTWDEMCHVKDLFFSPDECAVQYHPPRAVYRNHHQFCLHLWRPQDGSMPLPNPILVAPKSSGTMIDEIAEVLSDRL